MLGIIGGSGIYSIGKFSERDVNTPYGFAKVYLGRISKRNCAFVPRHGTTHNLPPHKINYRANIWALKQSGVEGVLATYACGAISQFKPGDFIAQEDFIGFNAPVTFYDSFKDGIRHVDASEPFSKDLTIGLISAAKAAGIRMKRNGIVATTHGPRYETKAEIRVLRKMGANLVSMTNAYEAGLLLEAEIPTAGLCIATNYAAGISGKTENRKRGTVSGSANPLSHDEVADMMEKKEREVNEIIAEFASIV